MKTGFELLEKTYDKCVAEGFIKPKDRVDILLITSLLTAAKEGMSKTTLLKQNGMFEASSCHSGF
mgnify:CR=1 FL=1|jgi:hypothetical protein|tara:strand:- start:91 stop:285 length:195 start_codon:yes stop_codon:yes gene_type:complete